MDSVECRPDTQSAYSVLRGRSRPDLVGQTSSGDWVAYESKGRISAPGGDTKDKAKDQADRLITISGVPPRFHIGCITYFRNDVLQFFWRDPSGNGQRRKAPIKVKLEKGVWSHYYLPVLELIQSHPEDFKKMLRDPVLVPVGTLDVEVGIHPSILRLLALRQLDDVIQSCRNMARDLERGAYQPDGIKVVAGSSWLKPFIE